MTKTHSGLSHSRLSIGIRSQPGLSIGNKDHNCDDYDDDHDSDSGVSDDDHDVVPLKALYRDSITAWIWKWRSLRGFQC